MVGSYASAAFIVLKFFLFVRMTLRQVSRVFGHVVFVRVVGSHCWCVVGNVLPFVEGREYVRHVLADCYTSKGMHVPDGSGHLFLFVGFDHFPFGK